jgi:hypothetical protein
VFVLVEPGIEQERLQLHASTPKKMLTSVLIPRVGAEMIFTL